MADTDTTTNQGGTQWDAPNQQAVRADQSPPWQEGTGGDTGNPETVVVEETPVEDTSRDADWLDAMTKVDLLALAKERGVSPANNDMTKQELIDGIRAQQAG